MVPFNAVNYKYTPMRTNKDRSILEQMLVSTRLSLNKIYAFPLEVNWLSSSQSTLPTDFAKA